MDLFLQACGASGPLQLHIEHQGRTEPVHQILHQPFALVGRDVRMDLPFEDEQVSRRHAYFQLIAGRLFCLDLRSRTGTHWERGPRRSGWLDYGQAVRIGPLWLRLLGGEANGQVGGALNRSAAEFLGEHGLPEATLEITTRSGRSWTWQMTPMLALAGRSPDCRVHLVSNSVSNYHCSLIRTPLGLWVLDLFGRGGIAVNEEPVRYAQLEDGDRLQLGKFQIQVRYGTRPGAMTSLSTFPALLPEPPTSNVSVHTSHEVPLTAGANSELPPSLASLPSVFQTTASAPSGAEILLVPTGAAAASAESVQALLVPVAKQLALMQQQMFDQFQQAMMMMFQMFNRLQQDQIAQVRNELDHLQQLTEEVKTLQKELAERTARSSPAARTEGVARPAPQPNPLAPAAPRQPAPREKAAVKGPSVPLPPPTAKPADLPQGQPEEAMHAWLGERLMNLQKERESTWQRIISFLKGK
jgi:pSer/pThr/pTyr-binding forkhead associated (FHA) protein